MGTDDSRNARALPANADGGPHDDQRGGASASATAPPHAKTAAANTAGVWSGTLVTALTVDGREIIPAGTTVQGAVTGAHPAGLGTRAMLDLAVSDLSIGSKTHVLMASTDAILADLPLHAAPPAAGRTPASMAVGTAEPVMPIDRGAEVVLDAGTEMVFTVRERAAIR